MCPGEERCSVMGVAVGENLLYNERWMANAVLLPNSVLSCITYILLLLLLPSGQWMYKVVFTLLGPPSLLPAGQGEEGAGLRSQ